MVDFEYKDHYDVNSLRKLISLLRGENGCPWDKVQTLSLIHIYRAHPYILTSVHGYLLQQQLNRAPASEFINLRCENNVYPVSRRHLQFLRGL